jgi:hypothetical protein
MSATTATSFQKEVLAALALRTSMTPALIPDGLVTNSSSSSEGGSLSWLSA